MSIIVIGPLTNLGLAISLDNNFPKYINKFFVMGGSVAGIGNKSPNVEFNFGADPVSDFIVFNSIVSKAEITLVPWEAALNSAITKVCL